MGLKRRLRPWPLVLEATSCLGRGARSPSAQISVSDTSAVTWGVLVSCPRSTVLGTWEHPLNEPAVLCSDLHPNAAPALQ